MKYLAVLPLLLLAGAASAQDVPEQTAMDLWCGIAFGIVSSDAPVDVTAEQQGIIDQYRQGGEQLVAKAKTAHLESGFTEESFASRLETLKADVVVQVNATDNSAPYTFEACSALIGL
jgi:hypothetical protein